MDILKSGCRISEILDVMRGVMHPGSDPERREGRPSDCFVYVLGGETDYLFGDRICTVTEGSVMYLPRGSTYRMRVKQEYSHIFIDFQFASGPMEPAAVQGMQALEGLFRRALRRWLKGSDSSMLTCMGILYEIYGQMMENRRNRYLSEEGRRTAALAAEWMLERLGDRELRMTDVARHAGVSTAHLRRLFQAVYGVAPNSYLQQKRVQRAKQMLIETGSSVEQVAVQCGFCNAYYFSRVFKALAGAPPGVYRAENGR